jgi:dipeptidyl aminopeptidase/acylaminoacyl peptidase
VSGGDIWTVAATGGEAHLLVTHPATESRPLYSPDGTKLAFVSTQTGAGNVYVLTLATGELTRLTYSDRPDSLDGWSHDGKWIYFMSAVNDIAGQGDIFRVSSGGGTPLEVSHERYSHSANQLGLYTYSLDELAKKSPVARQLTSTPGRKTDYAFTPDAKDVFYLENGSVKSITVESRTPKTIAVTAPMQIDFDVEKKVVFEEAWETLNRRFYDANFNGKNWLKLHVEWAPYIAGVKTSDELRRDINLLIGELNSSHSGFNRGMGPGNGPQPVQV